MKENITCPFCINVSVLTTKEDELIIRDRAIPVLSHFYKCAKCKEEFTTTETDSKVMDEAYRKYFELHPLTTKLIVAVNNNNVIGNNGDIPWRCKADLQHFKRMTLNSTVLVGRKTFEGLPPLKNREFIVISNQLSTEKKYQSLIPALTHNPDWIIGGAEIYKQTVHYCSEIHISHINNNSEGDAFFEIPSDYKGKVFHYYFEPDEAV